MALRDQPYLPLYIKDFMTDEKLMTCTAATTGVYIRLMCVMHKSEAYGTILLKQKFKQSDKQTNNFALQLANFMPYTLLCIESALIELLDEEIIKIDGDFLIQKRMVKDSDISEKRANAGKKGGEETQKLKPKIKKKFAKAKKEANTAIVIEDENVDDIEILNLKQEKEETKSNLKIAIDNYVEMRNKIRKPLTGNALKMLKDEAFVLAKGDDELTAKIFNQSTTKCYLGVFPLNEANKKNETTKSIQPTREKFGQL